MKKSLTLLLIVLMGAPVIHELKGQVQKLPELMDYNVYKRQTSLQRKPAPLPDIREADVVWSKMVWRIIDLREKANQHFYYPTREMQGHNNLFNILIKKIQDKEITAFDAMQDDDEFKAPISYDQVKQQYGATAKTIQRRNFETGVMVDTTIQQDMRTEEVKQLMVKELWYFDKQKSTLQVRILGLCPIRVYYRDEDVNQETILRKKLFWVSFMEVRSLLAKNEALNYFNTARNLSFDDLFLTRKFDSYIIKEENIYNNRTIEQYASGEYAANESERIKNTIFNFEQDLWEY